MFALTSQDGPHRTPTTAVGCGDLLIVFGSRQKQLALGSYPATLLADAREARRKAKGLLEAGIDPGAEKKERKVAVKAAREAAENTFAAVAEKYLTKAEREKVERPSR